MISEHDIRNIDLINPNHFPLKHVLTRGRRPNKSEKLYGYPKRYSKCDIRKIDFRNPKHFRISSEVLCNFLLSNQEIYSEILNNFSDMFFGYPKGFSDVLYVMTRASP